MGAQMNERQREAVECLEGPLLLLAGAGTGKTTVIVHRISNLVDHGIEPGAILAVTFTNKAAREMKDRIGAYVGPQAAKEMTISTFHSFCSTVLRRQIHLLGYSRHFSIASDEQQKGLVMEIMAQQGQVGTGYDSRLWRHRISMAKAACLWPEDVRNSGKPQCREVAQVYEAYQKRMRQMDLLDFDDLLCLTVKLWEECPQVLWEYRRKYKRILIDEYQDTNGVQLRIMTMLAGQEANLAVVGDDDQAIYGWRGADIQNILNFTELYPQAKVIRLEQNYRSTEVILRAANGVIAHNSQRHEKNLWSAKKDGERIREVRCADDSAEAAFLVRSIQEQHDFRRRPWSAFAVLFRSNRQRRILEESFRKARIPYHLVGGTSFYQEREILDARGFLAALANPRDDISFLRVVNVPPRGIGDTTLDRLHEIREKTHRPMQDLARDPAILEGLPKDSAAALKAFMGILGKFREEFRESGALHDKVRRFFDELGYLAGLGRMYKPRENALMRRDNVLEFLSGVGEYDVRSGFRGTLDGLLEELALLEGGDQRGRKDQEGLEAVTLMTVHAAKGLEFPVVYVAGMERDLFPHARAMEEGNEQEERRLFYVAITRAKEELFLTFAEKRREGKLLMPHPPSKFLEELPEDTVRFCRPDDVYEKVDKQAALAFLLGSMKEASASSGKI